jgi:CheY-like chemotaxis protein
VLIVDDILDNRMMYADYLRHVGYDVAEAGSGSAGIEKARELEPDVIVMDLAMPGMNGFSAIEELRRDERTQRARMIALTAFATFAAKDLALESGFDAFMSKPCTPDQLESAIRKQLAKS